MKIALCFHGLIGAKFGKSMEKKGHSNEVLEKCYEQFKKHIIDKNDVDVFFHTWDEKYEQQLIEKYNPVSYKVQKQKVFEDVVNGPTNTVQAHYSKWYSVKESNKLKMKYEKENNFEYDFVLSTRFDIYWTTDVIFSKFKKGIVYIPGVFRGKSIWGYPGDMQSRMIADHWFFGDNKVMNDMSRLYDKMNVYMRHQGCPRGARGINNHHLALHHLKKLGLTPDKVKRAFNMVKGRANINKPNEFQLYRAFFV